MFCVCVSEPERQMPTLLGYAVYSRKVKFENLIDISQYFPKYGCSNLDNKEKQINFNLDIIYLCLNFIHTIQQYDHKYQGLMFLPILGGYAYVGKIS